MFKCHSTSDCKQKKKTKLSRAEVARVEATQAEAIRAEATRAEVIRAEATRAEVIRAEATRAGTTGVGAIKEKYHATPLVYSKATKLV